MKPKDLLLKIVSGGKCDDVSSLRISQKIWEDSMWHHILGIEIVTAQTWA